MAGAVPTTLDISQWLAGLFGCSPISVTAHVCNSSTVRCRARFLPPDISTVLAKSGLGGIFSMLTDNLNRPQLIYVYESILSAGGSDIEHLAQVASLLAAPTTESGEPPLVLWRCEWALLMFGP